ncbi:response regulator [Cohnella ginsengisoli]|uniref:Response regulator n=1 Tax=Cohnella ginsengisoli TaxID=425004 RepID=A0A9X4KK85_9BACL|nr:response regulator [Cohnella ginsengisoli]MDG0793435.1 response regulator [Cohnella ginsengisoli]
MERDSFENILFVGGQSEHSRAIEAALDGASYRFVRARSWTEALRCLLREEIAVILIDVQMSGMNGGEAADHMKSHSSLEHIPVVFISGTADAGGFATGCSLGAIDFFMKPIIPKELKPRIQGLICLHDARKKGARWSLSA